MSHRNYSGFSIIEMLITIAIIALASMVVIPNLQRFRVNTELKTFKNQFKADIKQVKTWSTAVKSGTEISGFTYNDALVAYAMHFDTANNTYTIWEVWQDTAGNQAGFAEAQTPANRKTGRTLPKDISLVSLSPANTDIYFRVPDGAVSGSLGANSFTGGKITLTLQMKTTQNTISIWEYADPT
ncbi:hypothetical protein AUK40_06655 [Candidatus Wirthbacteria bacterium CG2_30_54_11]|uniref:General secretion pathway GspH domain-containing protein n=1 Tax=Candidatus Wirthbacteria bacterium CG2_30_54_11 TaxID=1817892 RepID=A0A1J5INQ7_9BACT|nr:MAG: hypothetical protein AUK40_06655 [Candidatus Wirthbacteria bacterium CG2_30_54_11]